MSESVEQAARGEALEAKLAGIAASCERILAADASTRALVEERDLLVFEWIEQLEAQVQSLSQIVMRQVEDAA